jgi:UDP-N-acetylenolpyruvoylglucosamine reductase
MIPLAGKTTMRIGGTARFYADLATTDDVEAAYGFCREEGVPLIVLGGGSNTVFADGVIDALVVRIKAENVYIDKNLVQVETGKNLPMLINELAKQNLDLSPLTGILGTVGGAVFGNAGQGPTGIWIDTYIRDVTVFMEGKWETFTKEQCDFGYRESRFKHGPEHSPVIWDVTLEIPSRPQADIDADIQALLKKRIETQPHVKTAGSCFKAIGGTPAWKLIDAAGLRGHSVGGVQIAEKHANFLLNTGEAKFADAKGIVEEVKKAVKEPLEVEMRFIENDGSLAF